MSHIIPLKTFSDNRWDLTVIEKVLPFTIQRIYYIYNVAEGEIRWGHRHLKTIQALICLQWNCLIYTDNWTEEKTYKLNNPNLCLILNPNDWHTMEFQNNAILLVIASELFDPDDYIAEKIKK